MQNINQYEIAFYISYDYEDWYLKLLCPLAEMRNCKWDISPGGH